jgi:elongation factor Ts
MDVKIEDIKKLRDMTGAGMMDAKKALVEAGGDIEKAIEGLRKAGQATAAKRSDRVAGAGMIESYVHSDRIGVLVEVNCETDFVARTDDFKTFARDVAMHIAASNPEYLNPEAVPENIVAKEREIYAAEVEEQKKPAEIIAKIVDGKLAKYFETVCLTKQAFIKDPDKSIEQLTTELIAKTGENIVIRRFSRLELGSEA